MSTNWITLSQTAGTGNQVVTVSAVTNEVMSERQLRIKITTGGRTEYVFVAQDAAPLMVTRIEFTGCQFPPISYTGGTLTASDGRYNITAYYNDGSVVPQVPATVTGSFSSSAINASLSVVSAGTMNLTASFSGKSASTTYTVMQMGVPEGHYIEYSGTSKVNVSGNWSNTGTTNVIANNYSDGYGIIVFDNTVDYLPYQAFLYQTGLTEVNIPSTVIAMSTEVFYGCTNLVAVNGLENLSSLYVAGQDGKQFAGCSSLSSITLPEVMTGQNGALPPDMFTECSSLTTIGYNGTIDEWKSLSKNNNWIRNSAIRYVQCIDGIYYIFYVKENAIKTITNVYYNNLINTGNTIVSGRVNTIQFDDSVTNFSTYDFYSVWDNTAHTTSFKEEGQVLFIQSAASIINEYAFHTLKLEIVTILPNVTKFKTNAFYNTTIDKIIFYGTMSEWNNITKEINWDYGSLIQTVECTDGVIDLIPNNVIKYRASEKLREVNGESSYNNGLHIEQFTPILASSGHTFENGVGTLTFSSDVTEIKQYAFNNCSGMTDIKLSKTVATINAGAWNGCKLSSFTLPDVITTINNGTLPSSILTVTTLDNITTIGDYGFANFSKLLPIEMPNVTSVGEYAFRGCTKLTNTTNFPSLVTVYNYAFYGSSMISVLMPNVTTIGDYAFSGCSKLKLLDIGPNLISIGKSAFQNCNYLSSVYYRNTMEQWNLVSKGENWHSGASQLSVIHCTDGDINL